MKIFTDASSYSESKLSGIAFIATDAKNVKLFENSALIKTGDNNTAELAAIAFALSSVRDTTSHITVLTDSSYALNVIRTNKCRPEEQSILDIIKVYTNTKTCSFMWIKGHCQDERKNILSFYNKKADRLAKNVVKAYNKEKANEKIIKTALQSKKLR